MSRRWRWPLVWRHNYDRMWTERNVLVDALRNANEEIRRHRMLLVEIGEGRQKTLDALDRIQKPKAKVPTA